MTMATEEQPQQIEKDVTMQPARVERIYIGGMDPDRLPISEVLERIPDTVKIQSVSHPPINPCYCHISATVDTSSSSALEILQKLLHNVKWKGCKLQVQTARPHFLERLRAEREARMQHHDDDNNGKSSVTASITNVPVNSTHRRYFRVRYAYGKPAWIVDTKPYQVSDGKVFGKMIQHVRKRKAAMMESDGKNSTPTKKPPASNKKPHRAVHWVFEKHDGTPGNGVQTSTTIEDETMDSVGSAQSSSASSSSDDESLSEDSTSPSSSGKGVKGKYVWSDDDDDNDDGASKEDNKIKDLGRDESAASESDLEESEVVEENDHQNQDNSSISGSSESSDCQQPQTMRHDDSPKRGSGTYAWSDDENDDDDDDNSSKDRSLNTTPPGRSLVPKDDSLDEFAAALDEDDVVENKTSVEFEASAEQPVASMEEDEARNLKVLADLFQEMAEATSKKKLLEKDGTENNTTKKKDGWNSSGQMMRYDPTKASSKQMEQVVEADSSNSSSANEDSENGQDKSFEKEEENEDSESEKQKCKSDTPEERQDIYRQDDLEDVFRQARESQAQQGTVVVDSETAKDNSQATAAAAAGGNFSFGFALEEAPPSKDSTTFSFGFNVADETKTEKIPIIAADDPMDVDREETNDLPPVKRRTVQASCDDLDVYVNAYFYELNDGHRMANDLDGWRNDSRVKEEWNRQRHKLTTDWKAKRKNAIARRNKFHKR